MSGYLSDLVFSDAVKAAQHRLGSRDAMERMARNRDFQAAISEDLAAFLARRDSFYLATASADGQPYVQHRGGPPGVLRVLDPHTLAFADFTGNRQYVTVGNLSENARVALLVMDYSTRRRVKIWGRARVEEDDAQLIADLHADGYDARPQRAMVITVAAWDINCDRHITPRHDEDAIARAMRRVMQENAQLKAEIQRLRGG